MNTKKESLTGSKTSRHRDLNNSLLSPVHNDLEAKVKKLEQMVNKLSGQNETLVKRIEDLESRRSKQNKKCNSQRSFSTMNNTLIEEIEELNLSAKNVNVNEMIFLEFNEWKKDIEKSIEKISERVANNNTGVLTTLLEKRVNDVTSEMSKLKKTFEDNYDNTSIIRKNLEKFDKTEKLITELLSQITNMKTSNTKYQVDFLKNLNEFDDKLASQDVLLDRYEKFEKNANKKIDNLNTEINRINTSLRTMESDNTKTWDDEKEKLYEKINNVNVNILNDYQKIENQIKEDVSRIDSIINNNILASMKALWDSFTLFTTSIK